MKEVSQIMTEVSQIMTEVLQIMTEVSQIMTDMLQIMDLSHIMTEMLWQSSPEVPPASRSCARVQLLWHPRGAPAGHHCAYHAE